MINQSVEGKKPVGTQECGHLKREERHVEAKNQFISSLASKTPQDLETKPFHLGPKKPFLSSFIFFFKSPHLPLLSARLPLGWRYVQSINLMPYG